MATFDSDPRMSVSRETRPLLGPGDERDLAPGSPEHLEEIYGLSPRDARAMAARLRAASSGA